MVILIEKEISKKRYWEVDILKSFAILLIILCHIHFFVFQNNLKLIEVSTYLSYFGLGLFFFLSGFTLYSNNIIETLVDVKKYMKKRIVKIFPLYWLALFSFFILSRFTDNSVFENDINAINIVFNIFGLQAFTKIAYIAMWYIGVILLYYLLYIIIMYVCKNDLQIVVSSLIMTVILIILYLPLNIIIENAPLYFLIFISGVLSNKYNLFYRSIIKKIIPFCIMLCFISTILYIQLYNIHFDANTSIFLKISGYAQGFIYHNVMLITSCFIFYWITNGFLSKINKALSKLFYFISYGSYGTYLFHLQTLFVLNLILNPISIEQMILFVLVGIIISFTIGYLFQKLYDYFLTKNTLRIWEKNKLYYKQL